MLSCLPAHSQKIKQEKEDDIPIFKCIVPQPATFPGGDKALHRFIDSSFVQPDAVPDSAFCKKGVVKFVIDKNGKACLFEIEECLGYNCDEEVIRILKLTKWKPALYEGRHFNETKRLPYIIMFERSEPINSNTSPRSEPACPPQTLSVISE